MLERLIAERLVHSRMRKMNESATNYQKQVEKILNYQLGSYEQGVRVESAEVISETPDTVTLKVDYSVDIRIPMVDPEDGRTYYEDETEYRSRTMTIDLDELGESIEDSDSGRVKLKYWTDVWNMIDKFGIEDWEDHDTYISVSEESFQKMLDGSKNKAYIMNLKK